jgi:hypothetical protein
LTCLRRDIHVYILFSGLQPEQLVRLPFNDWRNPAARREVETPRRDITPCWALLKATLRISEAVELAFNSTSSFSGQL